MSEPILHCRLCGSELSTGLVATNSRHCCLNATPIAGTCPEPVRSARTTLSKNIVAIENQCTPDRTTAVRSVCKSFQLLL